MLIEYSPHAKARQAERKVSNYLVYLALHEPDSVTPLPGVERVCCQKTLPDGKILKVIAAKGAGTGVIVVTVFIRERN